MPTPDPSSLPLAVWIVGTDTTALLQSFLDVLLVGFGVMIALLMALLVLGGFRRPG